MIHKLSAILLLIAACHASATSQCPDDRCDTGPVPSLVAIFDLTVERCSAADPDRAADYRAFLQRIGEGVDAEAMKALRASPAYRQARAELEDKLDRTDQRLGIEECRKTLAQR